MDHGLLRFFKECLQRFKSEPDFIGRIYSVMVASIFNDSTTKAFHFLEKQAPYLLSSPEFLSGAGRKAFRTKTLLQFAFMNFGSSDAQDAVIRFVESSVGNLLSRSASKSLKQFTDPWPVDVKVDFYARICEAYGNINHAAWFLRMILQDETPADRAEVLSRVTSFAFWHDMQNAREGLRTMFPDNKRSIHLEEVAEADADEDGNLAGFIVYSSDEDGSESENTGHSHEGSGRQRKKHTKRQGKKKQRKRLRKMREAEDEPTVVEPMASDDNDSDAIVVDEEVG